MIAESGTTTNEHDKEIHKERYISSEERQKIIDDLRLIIIIMEYRKIVNLLYNNQINYLNLGQKIGSK